MGEKSGYTVKKEMLHTKEEKNIVKYSWCWCSEQAIIIEKITSTYIVVWDMSLCNLEDQNSLVLL